MVRASQGYIFPVSHAGLPFSSQSPVDPYFVSGRAACPIATDAPGVHDRPLAWVGFWSFGFLIGPLIETRSSVITTAVLVGRLQSPYLWSMGRECSAELFSTRVRLLSAVSHFAYHSGERRRRTAPIIATGLYARYHSNFGVSSTFKRLRSIAVVRA